MHHYACGVLMEGNRILLGKRAAHRRAYPNCWDVVGGKVEEGETVDAALVRELNEELGIVLVKARPLGTIEDFNSKGRGNATYHLHVVTNWTGAVLFSCWCVPQMLKSQGKFCVIPTGIGQNRGNQHQGRTEPR